MKKATILFVILIPLALLVSCKGGKNKPKNNETPSTEVAVVEEPQVSETPAVEEATPEADPNQCVAFEVFQKIPKEDIDEDFRYTEYTCPENSTLTFEVGEYENSLEIRCFPYHEGGWLVVYTKEYCFDGCAQYLQLYNYLDDELTPIEDNVLPHANESDYISLLREALTAEEIDPAEWENYDIDYLSQGTIIEYYHFYAENKLELTIDYLNEDYMRIAKLPEKYYVWNGKGFETSYLR